MTGEQFLFLCYSLLAIVGALGVILSQNVVRMAFWLVLGLGAVSGHFFLLAADFVAATQLLIYVGGTAVLLIFGVMLTASGPYQQIKMSPADSFLAAGVGLLFFGMLAIAILTVDWEANAKTLAAIDTRATSGKAYNPDETGNTARPLGLALLGVRPDKDLGADERESLSTGYLLPFEIISIHLLVVLLGAAYLARAKRKIPPGHLVANAEGHAIPPVGSLQAGSTASTDPANIGAGGHS